MRSLLLLNSENGYRSLRETQRFPRSRHSTKNAIRHMPLPTVVIHRLPFRAPFFSSSSQVTILSPCLLLEPHSLNVCNCILHYRLSVCATQVTGLTPPKWLTLSVHLLMSCHMPRFIDSALLLNATRTEFIVGWHG